MATDNDIVRLVLQAQTDSTAADALIRRYMPFIRAQVYTATGARGAAFEDALSVGMIAFHEAVLAYESDKGAFLPYAQLRIRSRLTDHMRKEARVPLTLSLDQPDEEGKTLLSTLADPRDVLGQRESRAALRQEIQELAQVLQSFSLSFSDIAENCPRQERTLGKCAAVIRAGAADKELLQELLRMKKLPIALLSLRTGVDKKTIERHRKYILALLVLYTNGYDLLRSHLRRRFLPGKGTAPCDTSF